MKSFASTSILKRFWTHIRPISRLAEEYHHQYSHSKPLVSFEDAGLRPSIAEAVRTAFPHIKAPTEIQSTLISNVAKGKNIILQDETGSGKSFGLILALLNKSRLTFGRGTGKTAITSLVLVSHSSLAHQMQFWIEKIVNASAVRPPPLQSISQVLVREGGRHLTEGLPLIRNEPPHILIATPSAVTEIFKQDPKAFSLKELSACVFDEVDYMIETLPAHSDKNVKQYKSRIRTLEKHPEPARALLDEIYGHRERGDKADSSHHTQLILSSATIRRQLKHYFFSEKGYLDKNTVKIRGAVMRLHGRDDLVTRDLAIHSLISHHVLVASERGIVNLPSAVAPENSHLHLPLNAEDPNSGDTDPLPPIFSNEDSNAESRSIGFSMTPSTLDQSSLEAIAELVAVDVPSLALLIIPSDASVHRAVYDLREMGVDAHGMDLVNGRTFLSQLDAERRTNPTLLVCTASSIRGVDLPSLTHVFILGLKTLIAKKNWTLTLDTYTHLSGRVGRFGKRGKVITVVEPDMVSGIEKILDTLKVTPVQMSMFEQDPGVV